MNRLVVIGVLGIKRAYLNVDREEAVARFKREEGEAEVSADDIREFEFFDSFSVYDAWPHNTSLTMWPLQTDLHKLLQEMWELPPDEVDFNRVATQIRDTFNRRQEINWIEIKPMEDTIQLRFRHPQVWRFDDGTLGSGSAVLLRMEKVRDKIVVRNSGFVPA